MKLRWALPCMFLVSIATGCLFESDPDSDSDKDTTVTIPETYERPVITGHIATPEDSCIENVVMKFSGGRGSVSTLPDGSFSKDVPSNWTGTITPEKPDYVFVPQSLEYNNLRSSVDEQNFTAISVSLDSWPLYFPMNTGFFWEYSVSDIDSGTFIHFDYQERPLVAIHDCVRIEKECYFAITQSIHSSLPGSLYIRKQGDAINIYGTTGETVYLDFSAPYDVPWQISLDTDNGVVEVEASRLNEEFLQPLSPQNFNKDSYRLFRFSVSETDYWYEIYTRKKEYSGGPFYRLIPKKDGTGWLLYLCDNYNWTARDAEYVTLLPRIKTVIENIEAHISHSQ